MSGRPKRADCDRQLNISLLGRSDGENQAQMEYKDGLCIRRYTKRPTRLARDFPCKVGTPSHSLPLVLPVRRPLKR